MENRAAEEKKKRNFVTKKRKKILGKKIMKRCLKKMRA